MAGYGAHHLVRLADENRFLRQYGGADGSNGSNWRTAAIQGGLVARQRPYRQGDRDQARRSRTTNGFKRVLAIDG